MAIARSLLGDPSVVLLDEPTAALGVAQTQQVLNLIHTLRERGLGVVVISHNLADVFEVADRIVVLRLGKRVATFDVRDASQRGRRGRDHRRRVRRGGRERECDMSENAQTPGVPAPKPAAQDSPADTRPGGPLRSLGRMIAEGRAGSLLVILMIAAIWMFFQFANSNFLTAANLTNLMLQIAAVATISIGVVLVLLLGEIDLSVGSVSGLCAAIMAVLIVDRDLAQVLAVVIAIGVGALIGLFTGFMITRFGIPSFVITLAGLLDLAGPAALRARATPARSTCRDSFVTDLTSTFFSPIVGWVVAVAAIVVSGGLMAVARAPPQSGRVARRFGAGTRRSGSWSSRAVTLVAVVDLQPGPRPAPGHRSSSSGWRCSSGFITEQHALRPPHLRRRRQRRGRPALGNPHQPGSRHRVRARLDRSPPPAGSSRRRGCSR